MKRLLKKVVCIGLSALFTLACFGCSNGANLLKSALLQQSAKAEELRYKEQSSDRLNAFRLKTDKFSANFSATAFSVYEKDKNFAVSPISVYASLSLASECSAGNTRAELLSVLGVSHDELKENIGTLYRSLNKTYNVINTSGKKQTSGKLRLANSIWLQEGSRANDACLDVLSKNYYCDSYAVDFYGKNGDANQTVREFVKQKTNGLIDKNFKLPKETVFSLMNTLYLKDVWNGEGADLKRTQEPKTFYSEDGNQTSERFLQSEYLAGRAYKTQTYSAFYVSTLNGYKIKFILPEQGYTVKEVFTAKTLEAVNGISDWSEIDESTQSAYYTRCFFPEYEASYDENIAQILFTLGIKDLFTTACDMTPLTSAPIFCQEIQHATKLKVNRKGIEGAAVTVIQKAMSAEPQKKIYEDFLVDKSFAFIITDPYQVTLFSGVVQDI